jgi:hypothetical protein
MRRKQLISTPSRASTTILARDRKKKPQVWPDRALCSGNTDTSEEDTRTSMLLPAHNGSASHGL